MTKTLLAVVGSYLLSASCFAQFYVQKVPLNVGGNLFAGMAAHDDTLLLTGTGTWVNPIMKTVFWVSDGTITFPDGLEECAQSVPYLSTAQYFNHRWWLGGSFKNDNCQFLAHVDSIHGAWTSSLVLDSTVEGMLVQDDKLYVFGDFSLVNGQLHNHVFTIDTLGQIGDVGGGFLLPIVSGMFLGNDLYVIAGSISGYPYLPYNSEELWKYDGTTWMPVDLDLTYQYGLADVFLCKNPWEDAIELSGVFASPYGDWFDAVVRYVPSVDTVIKVFDCQGCGYIASWGSFLFFFGGIDEIDNQEVPTCNLNYLGIDGEPDQYNDPGCLGILICSTFFHDHFATVGSLYGSATIYAFDTIPFSLNVGTIAPVTPTIAIYPNPTKDFLTVSGADPTSECTFYNVIGEEVDVEQVSQTSHEIVFNIKRLPPGSYFVLLKTDAKYSIAVVEKL